MINETTKKVRKLIAIYNNNITLLDSKLNKDMDSSERVIILSQRATFKTILRDLNWCLVKNNGDYPPSKLIKNEKIC